MSQNLGLDTHKNGQYHLIRGQHIGLTELTALGVGEREERPPPGVVGEWLPEPVTENASFQKIIFRKILNLLNRD